MRQPDGSAVTTAIVDKEQLVALLEGAFALTLPEDTQGLDRYLPRAKQ